MDSERFRTSESHPFHRKVKGLRLQPWECQRKHCGEQSMKKCKVCGDPFVSTEQSNDIREVLGSNHIDFQMDGGFHLAELCLPCRRKYRISRFSGIATHEIKAREANQSS